MEKDADAFRTISEVAETLDIPPHVLRFWESKFPQIKPLKRGGGRRYYRRSDTDTLRTIRRLLYEDGYTIRGVQRLLRSRDATAEAARPSADRSQAAGEGTSESSAPSTVGENREPAGTALIRLRAEIAACRAVLLEALSGSP